ncbi:MAG: hypothetical protein R3A47_00795 [Polyangiales bacterium]
MRLSYRCSSWVPLFFFAAFAVSGCSCDSGSTGGDGPNVPGTGGTGGSGGGIDFADGSTPPDSGWTIGTDGTVVITGDGVPVTDGDGTTFECQIIKCGNRITACGDCSDNDGDGLTDWRDPECLGPCDNFEGPELLTGIGGETGEQCKADCYFDFGNGGGNDDCHWSRKCDPLEPKAQCTYNENTLGSSDCPLPDQSDLCGEVCKPLTPNGCDCFGCCEFPELAGAGPNGGQGYVYIGSEEGCTFDTVTDPNHCKPCTPAPSCLNDCGRCELCIGKTEIPDDCVDNPDPTDPNPDPDPSETARCPGTLQACGLPGDDPCPTDRYCVSGCCYIPLE